MISTQSPETPPLDGTSPDTHSINTPVLPDDPQDSPSDTANPLPARDTKSEGLQLLVEADLLLHEGLKRIAGAGKDLLPGAYNPIEEALTLSETQTLCTLEAVDNAQAAIHRIEHTQQGFIDGDIATIKSALSRILNSQQGQDLAGQRLKKALRLLQAVDNRISLALRQLQESLGITQLKAEEDPVTAGRAQATQTDAGQSIGQDEVDALLAELGI